MINYSLSFNSQYKDEAAEVRISARRLNDCLEFAKDNQDVRVNIQVDEPFAEFNSQIGSFKKVHENFTISSKSLTTFMQIENFPKFLNIPVTDWETFYALTELGVTDILVDGPTGFALDILSRKRRGQVGTIYRAIPNISANASLYQSMPITSFFIRPEDIDTYSEVIDIFEIIEDKYYNIYINKEFPYNFNLLFPQSNHTFNNGLLDADFGKMRRTCGQVCLSGKHCSYCSTAIANAKLLELYQESKSKESE